MCPNWIGKSKEKVKRRKKEAFNKCMAVAGKGAAAKKYISSVAHICTMHEHLAGPREQQVFTSATLASRFVFFPLIVERAKRRNYQSKFNFNRSRGSCCYPASCCIISDARYTQGPIIMGRATSAYILRGLYPSIHRSLFFPAPLKVEINTQNSRLLSFPTDGLLMKII